jgi:MFS family permease
MAPTGGWYVFLVALVAATGGFLFGFDLSIASGALPFLKEQFGLDAAGEGLAMSSAIFGSIAGPLAGMWLADRVGRRNTLWIAAACFLASAIGTALPRTITEFNVWRAVGGIGVGLAAMTSPMYIAELAPPRLRGRLVTVNQLAIVIGINLAVISSWLLSFGGHWRWMFASEIPAATTRPATCLHGSTGRSRRPANSTKSVPTWRASGARSTSCSSPACARPSSWARC